MGPLMGGPPGAPAEDMLRSTIQNNSHKMFLESTNTLEDRITIRIPNPRQKTGSDLLYRITVTRQANNPQDRLITPMVLNFLRAPQVPYMARLMGGPPGPQHFYKRI